MTGYFVSDFLYTELQELRLNQRLKQRTTIFNGYFTIPSFTSIMDMAQTHYSTSGYTIGIYPELKHPSFFNSLGFKMEDMLLSALTSGGYATTGEAVPNNLKQVVPAVVQCFEPASLQYLRGVSTLPLVLLLNVVPASFWEPSNIEEIAAYASGVGPDKKNFGTNYRHAKTIADTIHQANLFIHPWTFRADMDIMVQFNNSFANEEMYFYCCLGVDAVFSEFPDQTRETLDIWSNYTASHEHTSFKCPIDCSSF